MTRPNQGLSSLASGGGKMRDPGNEVDLRDVKTTNSIVFPPSPLPPPPQFYCFPSSSSSILLFSSSSSILLFSLLLLLLNSIVFSPTPTPPQFYCFPYSSSSTTTILLLSLLLLLHYSSLFPSPPICQFGRNFCGNPVLSSNYIKNRPKFFNVMK